MSIPKMLISLSDCNHTRVSLSQKNFHLRSTVSKKKPDSENFNFFFWIPLGESQNINKNDRKSITPKYLSIVKIIIQGIKLKLF